MQQNILTEEPTPEHVVKANLGGIMELIGYDLSPAKPQPGKEFTITWYWRCLEETKKDWMIFVHLDSYMGGRYRLNLDHHAVMGLHHTRNWKEGQFIKDVQTARFPRDFPEGEATIWLGAFNGEDRLQVQPGVATDGANRVRAGVIQLVRNITVSDLPTIVAKRAQAPLTIDGKLDEPEWERANSTGKWKAPDGQGIPEQATQARILWDDEYLYLGVECDDTDIWSDFTERDSNLWEQEVVEIFLQPKDSGSRYVELQVSPANVIFDALFASYRSDLSLAKQYDSGMKSAVVVDGTLNKRDDVDKGWTVEVAIPFAKLPPGKVPQVGDKWRMNLFRFDAPKGKRQEASAWSAPLVGDFHALHRFGVLEFAE